MSSLNNIVKNNRGYEIGHISHRKDGDYRKVGKDDWVKLESDTEKKSGGIKEETKTEKTLKEKQLEIIQKSNPMADNYHVGIRTIDDVKTFEEAMKDDESFYWGDFSRSDAEKALKKGKIIVYSSKPIVEGVFVSTSKNQAKDYAGGGKVYEREIPLDYTAWINGDEGMFTGEIK